MTLALLVPSAREERRARLRFFLAGAVAGLGVLIRQDGLAVGAGFVAALLVAQVAWAERAKLAGLALVGLVLAYGAWPARNLYRFGKPYLTGTFVDRYSNPFFFYTGYHDWMATWSADGATIPRYGFCFYDGQRCPQSTKDYPPEAFSDAAERAAVEKLFDLRRREGISGRVHEGFTRVAAQRRAKAPRTVWLTLPLRRAWRVWVNAHDDILRDPRWRPWLSLYAKLAPGFEWLAKVLTVGMLLGAALLALGRRTRGLALVLFVALAARTVVLAWTFYVEPRYTVEVMPAAYALWGGGLGVALAGMGGLVARRRRAPRAAGRPAP